jgi:hypothetical protein
MLPRIKQNIPTGLDAEYKQQLKQVARNNNPASKVANIKSGIYLGPAEDFVTLSVALLDGEESPRKLKPSQPVTFAEKQAIQAQFSVYA